MSTVVLYTWGSSSFTHSTGQATCSVISLTRGDSLTINHMRCVVKEGEGADNGVTFMRIFDLRETIKQKIEIGGWETFDQHPELIVFEGYYTINDKAFLERKLR
jgi:hypothetical protein